MDSIISAKTSFSKRSNWLRSFYPEEEGVTVEVGITLGGLQEEGVTAEVGITLGGPEEGVTAEVGISLGGPEEGALLQR